MESLLEQLDAKFDDMSSQILDRSELLAPTCVATDLTALSVMQMSTRVDALEAAIQDIINGEAATPGPPSMPQSPAVAQRRNGGV